MADCIVIAHRGAHRNAPPNTMPAFEAAVRLGCDSIETDVHCTSDGELVLCHNSTIDKTSNGRGKIRSMTLEKLFDYDFGAHFSPEFAGVKIPTLDEFFACMKSSTVGLINVEIKPNKAERSNIVQKTIERAKSFGVFERLLISSFDPAVLVDAKRSDSSCKTAYIYPAIGEIARRWLFPPLNKAKKLNVDFIHPNEAYVNRAIVSLAHRLGIKVSVWTVDKPSKIRKMLNLGVDGIITDNPELLLKMTHENTN